MKAQSFWFGLATVMATIVAARPAVPGWHRLAGRVYYLLPGR